VKCGVSKGNSIRYALKMYPKYVLSDPHKMRNVKREISLLKKLHHPSIIELPFAIDDSNFIVLVMEYIGKISLYNLLKSIPDRRLNEERVRKVFA
jgi:serine/threonine protein kinase